MESTNLPLVLLLIVIIAFIVIVIELLFRLLKKHDARKKEAEWVKITAIKRMRPILKDIDDI